MCACRFFSFVFFLEKKNKRKKNKTCQHQPRLVSELYGQQREGTAKKKKRKKT
jgi:hypothetical protein